MALYRNLTVIIRNIILITRNQHHQLAPILLCPAPNRRGIKQCFCLISICLMSVCLSRTSGPRTERPRKTKIGTRDSGTTFNVKRSKVKVTRPLYSPPCWCVRQLQRWAWERVGREKLLLRCRLLGRARRFGANGGEGGAYRGGRPPTAY